MNRLSTKKDITVSIAILTYNRIHVLEELLISLRKLAYEPLEIIVVDNNSNDGTALMVPREFKNVRYFRMSENKGIVARNVGLKMASGDIVITLDDDVLGIDDNDIKKIIYIFNSKKYVGAICFKVLDYETKEICNWCHHYRKDEFCDKEFITDEITEGAVAFRKSVFTQSGLYPSFYFISHEGPDLLFRMLDGGYQTIFSPDICVFHRTASGGRKKWRRYYYDTRNQIWLAARHYPMPWAIRYLGRGLTAMCIYSLRDGFFYYWAKGIYDGLKGLPDVIQDRKPFSHKTKILLREISKNRPGLGYMVRQRLFQREVKL